MPELGQIDGRTMMRATLLRSPLVLLAMILVGHVLAWWTDRFVFLDDIDSQHYAWLAKQMLDGKFTLATHDFNDRFGVTVPTAGVYAALGVTARTTTLWPLIASLLTILVVFAVAHRVFGRGAALLAALLLATNVVQIDYSKHLLPDIIVSAFMVASAALLHAGRNPRPGAVSRPLLHGGLCALAVAAGMVTKTSVVWAAPFFLMVMVYDLARRQNVRLWTAFVAAGAVCTGVFFLFYYLATGNPLHALDNIEKTHNVYACSFAGRSHEEYVERLTLAPLQLMVEQLGYGLLLVLAVPALIHVVCPLRAMPNGARYWAAYFGTVLLSFWFGTTSLRFYNPLPVSPRFLMPLLAPLAILGGATLAALWSERGHGRSARIGLLLIAAALAGAALVESTPPVPARSVVYWGLALGMAFLAAAPRLLRGWPAKTVQVAILAVLSLGVFLYPGAKGGVKAPNPLRAIERKFVRQYVARLPKGATVLTDEHSAFALPMLLERAGSRPSRIVDWNDAAAVRACAGAHAFVFVDQTTLSILRGWWDRKMPAFAREPPAHWRKVAGHKMPGVILRGLSLPDFGQQILLFEIDDPAELLPP